MLLGHLLELAGLLLLQLLLVRLLQVRRHLVDGQRLVLLLQGVQLVRLVADQTGQVRLLRLQLYCLVLLLLIQKMVLLDGSIGRLVHLNGLL